MAVTLFHTSIQQKNAAMLTIDLALVLIGGFIGTWVRYGITIGIANVYGGEFILDTWIANVVGCFFAGFFMSLSQIGGLMKYILCL